VQHRKAWELDVVEKRRLARMSDEHAAFRDQLVSRRKGEFEALKVHQTLSLNPRP
jgi:hypothetical protein